jgi:hypothetical protein
LPADGKMLVHPSVIRCRVHEIGLVYFQMAAAAKYAEHRLQ